MIPPLEVSAARQDFSLADAPFSAAVTTAREMQEKSVRSLPEALAEFPGVMVQKTANGQGSPYLRGFTGYRTLALVDGVRYNNSVYQDGLNEYFSLIDHHTLDRIELLEGPASVQYGSDAIGGTLNLLIRSSDFMAETAGKFYAHGSQSYRYASAKNSHVSRTTAELGNGGAWGLLLGFSRADFGAVDAAEIGKQRKSDYDQYGIDLRYDLKISDQWQLTLNHQDSVQDDVWRTHSTIFSESFAGSEIGTDLRRLKDQARSLNYAKLTGKNLNTAIDEAALTLSFQSWDEDGDRIKSDRSRSRESFDSRMLGLDLQLKSELPVGPLVYGFDAYQDRVDSSRTDFNPDGSVDETRIQGSIGDDSPYTLLGAYLQGISPLGNRWDLIAGSRLTRASADVGKFEDPATGVAASLEESWNHLSSSLRLSCDLDEAATWELWGGISQAFRAPNLGDLSRYGDSRSNETEIAATDLDPENFLTYEIGLKKNDGPLSATGTIYYTQIDDYITSAPTGEIVDGLTEVTKRNSGSGGIFGIELAGSYQFSESWSAKGNITYLEGELESFADASSSLAVNEPLSRIQPLTANISLRWDSPDKKWWGEFACTFAGRADKLSSGDEADTQRIPPGGTPGYALLNLHGGYMINENFRVSLSLENLLDQPYRVHGSGSNEPGFGVNTGITASF
ncbi:MAG: TonB-dependent receptor [Akkermansiaceae bacterium]|nr:TonB-dependent receptor [Akkermansiaceae bacterium]